MRVATRKAVDERSFTTAFLVDQSPFEVFAAVTNVRGWWTGEVKGKSLKVGDEFTFRYEDLHRSTQRVVEVIPEKRIVWLVTEAHLGFAESPAEWKGTRVVFDISKKGSKTELRFTHEGLVPSFECFDACHEGWTFYVEGSLRKLITTGRGEKELPWA
jgi:hypothetical protein